MPSTYTLAAALCVTLATAASRHRGPPGGPSRPPGPLDSDHYPGTSHSYPPPTAFNGSEPGKGSNATSPDASSCVYTGVDDGLFDYNALAYREVGGRNTLDWRIWLLHKCNPISFWHDVPLYPYPGNSSIINLVVEIPRWTDGKIELESSEPLAPIFHDDRNDAPRFVESVYPHKSYPFLYGSNSNLDHEFTGEPGDDDPMDFFDIGQDPGFFGQVKQSKVLGGLALIDGGETDWKILTIDINDPIAPFVNSFDDVEAFRPGMVQAFHYWFEYYKVPRGDEVIDIVGDGYQNASFITKEIVPQAHDWWIDLITGREETDLDISQTSFSQYESFVAPTDTQASLMIPEANDIQPAAAKPTRYYHWYFLNSDFELIEQV